MHRRSTAPLILESCIMAKPRTARFVNETFMLLRAQ